MFAGSKHKNISICLNEIPNRAGIRQRIASPADTQHLYCMREYVDTGTECAKRESRT